MTPAVNEMIVDCAVEKRGDSDVHAAVMATIAAPAQRGLDAVRVPLELWGLKTADEGDN